MNETITGIKITDLPLATINPNAYIPIVQDSDNYKGLAKDFVLNGNNLGNISITNNNNPFTINGSNISLVSINGNIEYNKLEVNSNHVGMIYSDGYKYSTIIVDNNGITSSADKYSFRNVPEAQTLNFVYVETGTGSNTELKKLSKEDLSSQLNIDLSNYYTKSESNGNFAAKNHVHSTLTLQIEGVTQSTYNGGVATTYNVSKDNLGVYSKSQVDTIINNLDLGGKPEEFRSNAGYSDGEFELIDNINISFYREVDSALTITDKNSMLSAATICNVLYKNTSGLTLYITLPNTGNYINILNNVIELLPGRYAEVTMKGYGLRRLFTYIVQ